MSEVRNAHWENHSKVLIAELQKQLQQSELCDCTIVAEGQSLKAHKVVLSACSPYFKSLFLQSHDKDQFVLHRDIKFRELKSLIEFVYYGNLLFSEDTIDELILAAEILQIRGLEGRSKACFQSTKQVVEKCPTEYFKKELIDCQEDQKPPLHLLATVGGFVPKQEQEWVEYNECQPQGTDTTHFDSCDAPQDPGIDPITITMHQAITAQISDTRKEPASNPVNHNRTARGINTIIGQDTYVLPRFSEFSVVLQDAWKEEIFRRDNEGHFIISGIKCDFHPLVSSTREMQTEAHDQPDSFCSESSALLSHATNHVKTRGLENKYSCFECGKTFKCAFNLDHHLWSHAVDRPYVCNICGKSFSVKGNYKHHVYLHSNERPYVCQGCGKSFKVVSSLQSHYRQYCGKLS